MRYSNSESTKMLGTFDTGSTVTIKVINLDTDTLESLTSNSCTESTHISGMFYWDISNLQNRPNGYQTYAYEMTDGTSTFYGKWVDGGVYDHVEENIGYIHQKLTTLIAQGAEGLTEGDLQDIEGRLKGVRIIL